MPELKQSLGYRYLQETKFSRQNMGFRQRPHITPADFSKHYPDAEKIALASELPGEQAGLWQTMHKRRSIRQYGVAPMDKDNVARLLWATQGITARAGPYYLRTAPSAGALYPIETYLAVEHVKDIEPGLFHFDVLGFQLERLTDQPPGKFVSHAALDQSFMAKGSIIFIWSALLRRTMSKYGHRGLRYICMDVGHICQNLLLAATALGFDACPVAAFYDDEINELLELDGEEESVIYMAVVGPKRK